MFTIIENIMQHQDIGVYTTYGIAAGNFMVEDISTDRAFVENLAAMFEREQLAPEHLRDAVEDAIILASISSERQ